MLDESSRLKIAIDVILALGCQAGVDVVPAASGRILTGVYKLTGYKFKQIGHGRSRDVFDIVLPEGDPELVLKLGSIQSNARERWLTEKYPEDWAKIYVYGSYGVVSERAAMIDSLDDERTMTAQFKKRMEEFNSRYINLNLNEIGFIGDRIVTVGSSTRIRQQDANGGQYRAV
jgi:hypothetical protein